MDEFYRLSTVTGKTYNVFDTVKILNIQQAIAYMNNEVLPLDIKIGTNKDGKKCLIFYFDRAGSKVVYDLWCKHELN